MEVGISDNKLDICGNEVCCENTIGEAIEFDGFVILRLALTGEEYPGIKQNVMRVDRDGSVRWRIEKAPKDGGYDAYSGIQKEGDTLYAYNLSGISYEVDLDTGKISDGQVVK